MLLSFLPIASIAYSLALLLAARYVCDGWYSYSLIALFTLAITLYLPLAVAPGLYVSGLGLLFLFEVGFALLFGITVGRRLLIDYPVRKRKFDAGIFRGFTVLILWALGVICGGFAAGLAYGVSDMSFTSSSFYEEVAAIAVLNASNRYQGVAEPTVMQSLLLSGNYLSCLLAGSVIAACKISKVHVKGATIITLAPLATLAAFGILQNTKANILYGTVLYLSGFLSVYLLASPKKMPLKFFFYSAAKLIVVIILLIFFLAFMQSMRYGVLFLSHEELYIMIAEYAIAHVSGFQYWFDYYLDHGQDLYLGGKTFAGIFNLFTDSLQGSPTLLQNKYVSPLLVTNVDTALADLIMDFGVGGSLLFMFLSGGSLAFIDHLRCHGRVICVPIAATFIAFFLWFFTTSIFTYSSIILSIFLYFSFVIFELLVISKKDFFSSEARAQHG